MGTDADIHKLGFRLYQRDDTADVDADQLVALGGAIRDLAARVSRLEQILDSVKDGAAPGKPPQRHGRAPTGETLHRRARIRIRP
jgi:hypothetical protein